ncbi:DUF4845 domain-containing protein [Biformimicrobium ophioploci]|nr:DUF4845 domain-containing protein [Microbulbifer sp. NKW57]
MKNQKGMSYWGLLGILAVGGLALTCVSKMGPAYIDAYYVEEGLRHVAKNDNVDSMKRGEILRELDRYFTINNVRGEPTKAVRVVSSTEGTIVSIDYELRVPLISNVDVVMKFDKQLNTNQPELCCDALVDLTEIENQ